MRFELKQISSNRLKTTFRVVNDKNETVGSINVANAEVPALQKCWAGARSSPAAKPAAPRAALPRLSRAANSEGFLT
jgi:hypothetical protein